LAVIGIGLVVWAALAVQAAIVGQREDARDARLREELSGSAAVTAVAPAAVESFPMAVSDQAKATPFDATLPPASLAPVKEITLTATDSTVFGIAKDVNFTGWTFGDTVPARPIHVRQGDTVKFTLVNNGKIGHSMDFHAASINPGMAFKTVLPGESFSFEWTANYPGVFMFHCGTAPVIEHLGNGMYGAIIVDPAEGLTPAREYALVQSEFYLGEKKGDVHSGDVGKMLHDSPDYVVFNGMANQYRDAPLVADPGELIRLWVVNAGPSQYSAFHVIGAVFSAVYPDGNLANKLTGVSTYNIPAGGAAMFELTIPDEGTYPFVTHSFADASKGALGVIKVGNPAAEAAGGHDMTPHQAAAATTLDVAGTDNKFGPKDLTAKVGEATTITFANKGAAIHNLRIAGLAGEGGKDAQTALLPGGQSGSVTFTPQKAGTYKVICDIHPAEMTGTLVVK
jgi:nitrite reductase (NO-forming)